MACQDLVGNPPAARGVVQPGEGIDHRIDVRADRQAEMFEIVAGVDGDGQPLGRQHGGEPGGQLGPADTAGKREDVAAAHRNMSSASALSPLRRAGAIVRRNPAPGPAHQCGRRSLRPLAHGQHRHGGDAHRRRQ